MPEDWNIESARAAFIEATVEVLQVTADQVTMSAVPEDLDADSLDIVELVMALEEKIEITIEESELENVSTIGDLFNLVLNKLGLPTD